MKRAITKLLPSVAFVLLLWSQNANSQNLLVDSTFTGTSIPPYVNDPPPLNMWVSWVNPGTGASFTTGVLSGVCTYFIDNPGVNMYDVQLTQYGFPLILNHRHRLSFDVKADAERDFGVFLGEYGVFSGSWTNLNPTYTRHATTDWQTITIDVDATRSFAINKLSFEMGIQGINMSFRNVSLMDLGPIPLDRVVIAGTFESELGCPGDWMPDCNNAALTLNSSTGLWTGSFNVPAGCHQYKVTINGSWDVNYGENGIKYGANYNLYVPTQTLVNFTFDPSTNIVQTSPIASGFSTNCLPQVVLVGSFQSILGCASAWDANCLNTALTYSSTSGLFENDFAIPPGYYEYRVVLNGDWAGQNFGFDGMPNAPNYSLYVPCSGTVHFAYNPVTHQVTSEVRSARPETVVVAGSFQSEVGCSGDWQPDCNNTRMHFDPNYQEWFTDTLSIPAGQWQFKFTINNSWAENYGQWGVAGGDNIPLNLCAASRVVIGFSNCSHSAWVQTFPDPVHNTAVVVGSFQSELGCATDWQMDCEKTRMKFNAAINAWVDTLLIPAGHWEYNIALNNSMVENYGSYTLDLCYPAKVAFLFYQYECYGYAYAQVITNGICVNSFYDANTNGYPDFGEEPMGGISFTLTGNGIRQTQTSGSDGKAAFYNLPDGMYVVRESVPQGYYTTGYNRPDSQLVYLSGGNTVLYFGNACIGAGGAKGMGFWTSKNAEAALNNSGRMEEALSFLRYLSLRNADGSDFDPYTYAQLKEWMMGANAKNMTYMLSAQLTALYLNTVSGYVNPYTSYVYVPGCITWSNFMNVSDLIWYTNYVVLYLPAVDGKNPARSFVECMKNTFDNANSNLTFVQPHPCNAATTQSKKETVEQALAVTSNEPRLWPNPSRSYFTLRPANNGSEELVSIKVYNVNGQIVYDGKGSSNGDYRFGEKFIPGIYLVELVQGNKPTTFKVVKQ
ncbi:MAG: pullulanase X25 domain-containing protein [Flavisolibacter sp.]